MAQEGRAPCPSRAPAARPRVASSNPDSLGPPERQEFEEGRALQEWNRKKKRKKRIRRGASRPELATRSGSGYRIGPVSARKLPVGRVAFPSRRLVEEPGAGRSRRCKSSQMSAFPFKRILRLVPTDGHLARLHEIMSRACSGPKRAEGVTLPPFSPSPHARIAFRYRVSSIHFPSSVTNASR